MKNYKYFLYIMFIILIIPIVIKTFTTKQSVSYKVNAYDVKETFHIDQKEHYYDIKISNSKEEISYTINNNFNKRKKIISNIKLYKEGNITCILPQYKNKIKKKIYCLNNKKQMSNYYLRKNKDYKKILSRINKNNIEIPSSSSKKENYKNLSIYKKNIQKNSAVIIWDYKGIYIVKNDSINYQKFINYDIYENVMSTVTDNYYILFENMDVMGINKMHYYNIKNNKHKVFKLKKNISKDSYINGVIGDDIYITDIKGKKEYIIKAKNGKMEEIGNEDLGYTKYSSGKKIILNKSDFFIKKQLFTNERIKNNKITKNNELVKYRNIYYYPEKKHFYKQIDKYNKVLLFEHNNIDNWFIYKDDIVYVDDNKIFIYNDDRGLRKVIEYNELRYNAKNIVSFWKS